MKKILAIATFTLGLSAVAVSALAASNNDMWGAANSSEPVNVEEMAKEKGITVDELIAQFEKENKKVAELTDATEAKQGNNDMWGAANSSEPVNLEKMAKEKGITVDQLIAQLEKEGTLTKAGELTEAQQVEINNK